MKNFYQYCEDEQLKIKVEGMPIHRFFAPEGFLLWGLEPKAGNYNGYAQIVDMPIGEFLGLAEPIPEDDEKHHSSIEAFKKEVLDGKPTNWDIPYLKIRENEDGIWKVIGHDGRHRGRLLQEIGYETMPVLLMLPEAELNEELLPDLLWGQNDKATSREKDFYPFPITEDNYMQPYVEVGNGVVCVGGENPKGVQIALDKFEYGKGCTNKDLKRYMGEVNGDADGGGKWTAPWSCAQAKRNFAKNFVDNPAYRKDLTMPARNLKEYLEQS